MEKAKYKVGDKVSLSGDKRELVILNVRENVYDPRITMYGLGEPGEVYDVETIMSYPDWVLDESEVTPAEVEPKLFEPGESVWVDDARGGRRGHVVKGDAHKMPNGIWVQYSIKYPGGADYEGHTDRFVNGDDVYKYSPLERLARIEKALGIED